MRKKRTVFGFFYFLQGQYYGLTLEPPPMLLGLCIFGESDMGASVFWRVHAA